MSRANGGFASMDEMMGMSFDQMRASMGPAHSSASHAALSAHRSGGDASMPLPLGSALGTGMLTMSAAPPSGPVEIPDHRQELDVYFVGPGAAEAASGAAGLSSLDAARAEGVCAGKSDFSELEALDAAVRRGERVVIAVNRGDRSLKSAQAYLATSIARWLSERQPDGAGRLTGVSKNVDPATRKHFTRRQIQAIVDFAGGMDGQPR